MHTLRLPGRTRTEMKLLKENRSKKLLPFFSEWNSCDDKMKFNKVIGIDPINANTLHLHRRHLHRPVTTKFKFKLHYYFLKCAPKESKRESAARAGEHRLKDGHEPIAKVPAMNSIKKISCAGQPASSSVPNFGSTWTRNLSFSMTFSLHNNLFLPIEQGEAVHCERNL